MLSDTSGKMMEVVRQSQQSCSTDCRSVLLLASTALCVGWGVAGVCPVHMDRSGGEVKEFRGKMVGWLSLIMAGMVRADTLKLNLFTYYSIMAQLRITYGLKQVAS
jgi:hypothetical protein